MDWYCNKCKAQMEEVSDIKVFYGELDLPDGAGYRCPVCGIEFMDADFVILEMAPAEQMLEGK